MKLFLVLCCFLASLSSFAGEYQCFSNSGTDVGTIEVIGDPVNNQYDEIWVNGIKQNVRQSTYEAVYLYLYKGNDKTFALEVFNYPASSKTFYLYIYGPDHIVLGGRSIGTYKCDKF
jgi:hypothetical protein